MPRQFIDLSTEGLVNLDQGQVALMLDGAIGQVSSDLRQRPLHPGPRSVTLTIKIKPVPNKTNTEHNKVGVTMDVKVGLPKYESVQFEAAVTRQGLQFNEDFPSQLDGQALPGMSIADDRDE